MSIDPGTEAPGFGVEYGEPEPASKQLPRHARRRDRTRVVIAVLSGGLVVAVGWGVFLLVQLDATRDDHATVSAARAELAAALEASREREAELEGAVAAADEQLSLAVDDLSALQRQLTDTEGDTAAVQERLEATEEVLGELRRNAESLASAVFGSVDPVDACERAADLLAEQVDEVRRGALGQLARQAADACAAAAEAVQEAVPRASTILSGT